MKNNLLPWALTLLFPAFITAQKPVSIPLKSSYPVQNQADWICNDAGTIEVGQFIGQSIDTDLDQIFLCFGDSILIKHHGDADLSGDPNPSTIPGIGFSFYNCPPTVSGPSLQDVIGDPCVLQSSSSDLYITQGIPNGGDSWFFNNGFLQDAFNIGQPLSLFFAPITIDNFASNTYESTQIGMPPGPCVGVNVDEAFEVVYLNKITATGITNNFGNDCVGRFTVRAGLPQYDQSETYDIDISLTSDPAVKGLVMTDASNLFHLSSVSFSVCQPGLYTVNIEDGKSCGHLFQVNMSGCNASDNVGLDFEEVVGVPGETVCVPLKVTNFNVLYSSFSITWNPALLHFTGIGQINPAIANLIDSFFVNTTQISNGNIGLLLRNATFPNTTLEVPDGEALFEICFEVLDSIGSDCIAIAISNDNTGIETADALGQSLGLCAADGGVCKPVATNDLETWEISKTFPNPVRAGESANLTLVASESTTTQLLLCNAQGRTVQTNEVELSAGENRVALQTTGLSPGVYFLTVMAEERRLVFYKIVVF